MKLIDELNKLNKSDIYPFHMPGHKRRLYTNSKLKDMYGIDITEIDGFDNLNEASGILKESMDRAAKLFKADKCIYSVNGSTAGILASICALTDKGDRVILARCCHKSVYNAIMLSGAIPSYIYPEGESLFEINAGISALQVKEALAQKHDGRTIVVLTSPTYEGIVSDIEGIAKACHENNATLVVDAAHGAHLGLSDDFPKSAQEEGADVVIASLHKTLPSPTQTAMVLLSKSLSEADKDRIVNMMKVFTTSSPSYPLMAGIDECINLLDEKKDELFANYARRLDAFYEEANKLKVLSVLTKDKLTGKGSVDFDKGKIIIKDNSLTLSGKDLYNVLRERFALQPEMAAGSYCLMMTSIADDDSGYARLITALKKIDRELLNEPEEESERGFLKRIYDKIVGRRLRLSDFARGSIEDYIDIYNGNDIAPKAEMSIKQAILSDDVEWVPVELSEDRISADYITPYPPCVPIVVPGEVLSADRVDKILNAMKQNLTINGVNNGNIRVIK